MRPEPSRRREAEEQIGGDVVRARLQDPQAVVRTAEEARLQPHEELEAAVDLIYKHVKELGALHVAESDVGEIFLPGRSAKLGRAPSASSQVRLWTCGCGWDLASAAGRQECWKTLHAERPRVAFTLDQRRTSKRDSRGSNKRTFAVRRLSMANKQSVEYTFSTNIHGELPRGTWTA